MPRRRRRFKVEAANGRWSDWIYPRHNGYRMGCCDCGLVHEVDFRVDRGGPLRKSDGGLIYRKGGHVKMRVARDNRSTAMLRRYAEPTLGSTFLHHAADSLIALYTEHPEQLDAFLRTFRTRVRQDIREKKRAPAAKRGAP